jgi:error-prone DNA polymerase
VFTELLGRSSFSFLRGASHPEEMVARAFELKLSAIAICDRDGLYGSVRALRASQELEQRVIVGAELTVGEHPKDIEPPLLALLVETHCGYQNLCQLLTLSHADREKGTSALDLAWLERHHEGLVAVLPAPRRPGDTSTPPPALLQTVREVFGERGYLAAHRHRDGFDRERMAAVERWPTCCTAFVEARPWSAPVRLWLPTPRQPWRRKPRCYGALPIIPSGWGELTTWARA